MNDEILLRGKPNYLSELRPYNDFVYDGKSKAQHKQHPFIAFVSCVMLHTKRKAVVEVVRDYVKCAKLRSKKEAVEHFKSFLDPTKRVLNCHRLCEQLSFVIAYKHLNSVVYFEAVMQ